jgi:hypothetical protein
VNPFFFLGLPANKPVKGSLLGKVMKNLASSKVKECKKGCPKHFHAPDSLLLYVYLLVICFLATVGTAFQKSFTVDSHALHISANEAVPHFLNLHNHSLHNNFLSLFVKP